MTAQPLPGDPIGYVDRWSAAPKIAVLALSLGAVLISLSRRTVGEEAAHPVPKAFCGSQDRTESVQGETTFAERFGPGPAKAYHCNLDLVGQFEGEGAGDGMDIFENCVYYSTAENPTMQHPGVAVLDVSDSQHPQATAYLDSPAMLAAYESLEIATTRKLLLASKPPTPAAAPFDLYDLSVDCRHPVLKSSISLPRMMSHAGKFAPDGQTFYGASFDLATASAGSRASAVRSDPTAPPASAVFAIDTSDPSNPRGIGTWIPPNKAWQTHGVSINRDGTRAYVTLLRVEDDQAKAPNPNGLVILDVSDLQARRPHPQFRLISTLFWDDTHIAQFAVPVTIKGRPYLIFTDYAGAIRLMSPPADDACDSGRPGHGFARIIDIGDEKHPKTVSKLMLGVDDPTNYSKVMHDPTLFGAYGSFGCNADDDQNARLLACGYLEGGVRVFDIRDPARPREIAYYKPPARRTQSRPGSVYFQPTRAWSPKDHTADPVMISPRFRKHGEEIWFISCDNGFQVVRFTDRFKASHKDLFLRAGKGL